MTEGGARVNEALALRLRAVESRNLTFVAPGWPVFWKSARGSLVRDAADREFIDFTSGFGVAAFGHAHPAVALAAAEQGRVLPHGLGDVHPPVVKVELLERLAATVPWPSRTILGLNGSDAVEAALKTALIATGRPGVIAFEGAYHGLIGSALEVTWRREFREPFAARSGRFSRFVSWPEGDGADSLEELERALADGAVGAVIVEPVQGRGGARVPPPGWGAAVSRLTHSRGALLITDEILTGLGRTGSFWAGPTLGFQADILCAGKALGGGWPLSACVGRAEVMEAWPESDGEAIHTATFLGHPVSCAAALAALVASSDPELPDRVLASEGRIRERLGRHAPRGLGLLLGIPCRDAAAARRVVRDALDQGLLILADGVAGDTIMVMPPLTIPAEELDRGLSILEDALAAVA